MAQAVSRKAELSPELAAKAQASIAILRQGVADYGRVVYSSSLGAEAMVLTDLIWTHVPQIDIVSVDTGRLHAETLDLLDRLERRYRRRIKLFYPEARAVERFVAEKGINGFYQSLENRQLCCEVRKVEPFRRAVAGYSAWVTGVRRDQSATRAQGAAISRDEAYGLHKLSPLLEWTEPDVWEFIRVGQLPYNPLHDKQFASIGCAPCTRAVEPGADQRSGRWWWENPETRECGLHPRELPTTLSDL